MNNMEKKEIKSSDFGFAPEKLPCHNTVPVFLTLWNDFFCPQVEKKLFEADLISSLLLNLQAFIFSFRNLTPVAYKERRRLRDSGILHAERVWIS